ERRRHTPNESLRARRLDLEGRWRSRLLTHFSETSAPAMAYQLLVQDLRRHSREQRQKVWLVASGVAGEGNLLSCMNLAIAAQKKGLKTLIIEGHTRSPRISHVFRLDLEPGLTGCLRRALTLQQAVRQSNVGGVSVLPAGHSVAYPETLWATP